MTAQEFISTSWLSIRFVKETMRQKRCGGLRLQTMLSLACGIMIGVTLRSQVVLEGHLVKLRSGVPLREDSLHRARRGHEDELMIGGSWSGPDSGPIYWIDNPNRIPPLVHQIWDDDVVENSCQVSGQSWEWFCSVYGCKYKLWRRSDLDSLTPFINRNHYEQTVSPQMRADLARLEILNKHGGLYLDCDMIWGGRSQATDAFVSMLSSSHFAVAPSNDIRNATGREKNVDLAVVFFTNRVMGSVAKSPILDRTIELAKERLDEYQRKLKEAVRTMGLKPRLKAFHMTGPNVLNMALQYVSDAIPVDVIPTKWIYPSSMTTTQDLVMFGHSKDRSVHANNNLGSTVSGAKPWLMQRSLPNFFTVAQDPTFQYDARDYLVKPGSTSEPEGAIAIFLHHNKAGGTGVKVALQQLYNTTANLTHVDVFSKSACAYAPSAITRHQNHTIPSFCQNPEWKQHNLPACGRCRAPGLASLQTSGWEESQKVLDQEHARKAAPPPMASRADGVIDDYEDDSTGDLAPSGATGAKGRAKCEDYKSQNKCRIPIMRNKCCNTCGALSCPNATASKTIADMEIPDEVTPTGQHGRVGHEMCQNFKAQGLCGDQRLRGFCCVSCGAASCSAPHMVVGDYAMGLCNILPASRPCAYYTMLREPRARVASSFLHCKYEPDDQLCMTHVLDARKATFAEWVQHQGNYLFRQLTFDLTQALSTEEQYNMYLNFAKHRRAMTDMEQQGAWISPSATGGSTAGDSRDDSDLVDTMLQHKPNMLWLLEQQRGYSLSEEDATSMVDLLEYRFAVIGIVEQFDESLEMFEAVFGLPFPAASHHRSKAQAEHQMHVHDGEDISRRKLLQDELVAEFQRDPQLDEYIQVDLALYDRAVELFEAQRRVINKMKVEVMKQLRDAETGVDDGGKTGVDDGGKTSSEDATSWLFASIAEQGASIFDKTSGIISSGVRLLSNTPVSGASMPLTNKGGGAEQTDSMEIIVSVPAGNEDVADGDSEDKVTAEEQAQIEEDLAQETRAARGGNNPGAEENPDTRSAEHVVPARGQEKPRPQQQPGKAQRQPRPQQAAKPQQSPRTQQAGKPQTPPRPQQAAQQEDIDEEQLADILEKEVLQALEAGKMGMANRRL